MIYPDHPVSFQNKHGNIFLQMVQNLLGSLEHNFSANVTKFDQGHFYISSLSTNSQTSKSG